MELMEDVLMESMGDVGWRIDWDFLTCDVFTLWRHGSSIIKLSTRSCVPSSPPGVRWVERWRIRYDEDSSLPCMLD